MEEPDLLPTWIPKLWIQSYQLKLTDNPERSEKKSCSLSFTQFPSILPNFGKLPRNAASLILPFAAMLL